MSDSERGQADVKQREIAHGCSMTVVTEPNPAIHMNGVIEAALDRTYPEADGRGPVSRHGAGCGGERRYDLISVPGLKYAAKNDQTVELLAEDILTAVGLHGTENVLVVTADHSHSPLVQKLDDHPKLKRALKCVRGYTAKPRRDPAAEKTLAVACMDWRLHGAGGFVGRLAEAFRLTAGFGLMTLPGAAKELGADMPRGAALARELERLADKGLRRVILVSHTDCGKYGGDAAFSGPPQQQERLRGDLAAARAFIMSRLPGLAVSLAIAVIADSRVEKIGPVADVDPTESVPAAAGA